MLCPETPSNVKDHVQVTEYVGCQIAIHFYLFIIRSSCDTACQAIIFTTHF